MSDATSHAQTEDRSDPGPASGTGLARRLALGRRGFLLGCSAAATPLVTPLAFAAAPGENRLVVIVLRGGLDGLSVAAPWEDRDLAALRPTLALTEGDGARDLDGRWALSPHLAPLTPLWAAGELALVHATATPYAARSHFDGQDVLETGGQSVSDAQAEGGWLNRALSLIPGAGLRTGLAVGEGGMLLMRGDAPATSWSPTADIALSGHGADLLRALYARDPMFAAAAEAAFDVDAIADAMGREAGDDGAGGRRMARFAAEMLNGESRIAAFSLTGFDTHITQAPRLRRPLSDVAAAILELKRGLGSNWSRTAVLCMTEFGRTVRQNGANGTDHGAAGAMLLAGGALSGARVHGAWPGVAEGDLKDGRELMPTSDLRGHAGAALSALFGLSRAEVERTVFPGLDMPRRSPLFA